MGQTRDECSYESLLAVVSCVSIFIVGSGCQSQFITFLTGSADSDVETPDSSFEDAGEDLADPEPGEASEEELPDDDVEEESPATWSRTYSGPGHDGLGYFLQRRTGEYLVLGDTSSFGAGETDVLILELDAAGDILRQTAYGTPDYDSGTKVIELADGAIVVLAWTDNPAIDGYSWVMKLSEEGLILWSRMFQDDSSGTMTRLTDIRATMDGEIIASGEPDATMILKISSDGSIEWQKSLSAPGSDYSAYIIEAGDGTFFLAGANSRSSAFHVARLDSNGEILWQELIELPGIGSFGSLQLTGGGELAITGYINFMDYGLLSVWAMKMDFLGNILWSHMYDLPRDEQEGWGAGLSFEPCPDGGLVGLTAILYLSGGPMYRLLMTKIDPAGDFQWARTYASYDTMHICHAWPALDGGYGVAAPVAVYGENDTYAWVLKTDASGFISESCPSWLGESHTLDVSEVSFEVLEGDFIPGNASLSSVDLELTVTQTAMLVETQCGD